LVAFAVEFKALTMPAFRLRLVAFDTSLFARNTAFGTSSVDHDDVYDTRKRVGFATS
jgi:hypothetical protein